MLSLVLVVQPPTYARIETFSFRPTSVYGFHYGAQASSVAGDARTPSPPGSGCMFGLGFVAGREEDDLSEPRPRPQMLRALKLLEFAVFNSLARARKMPEVLARF